MSEIDWSQAQKAAINMSAKRILVSAAAGSGKSTVLTERIISAITDEKNPKDLQKMMVVTFTRASADDLKGKIAKALRNKVVTDPKNKFLNGQLIKLPAAKINTIHGVCYSIIKSRFDTLGLPASVSIADETLIKSMRISEMNKLLDDCYNGLVEGMEDFEAFCDNFVLDSDDELTDKLIEVYDKIKNEPNGFDYDYSECYDLSNDKFLKTPFGKRVVQKLLITLDYFEQIFKNALTYFNTDTEYLKLYDSFVEVLGYIARVRKTAVSADDVSALCELLRNRPKASGATIKKKSEIGQHYRTERTNFTKEIGEIYDTCLKFFEQGETQEEKDKALLHLNTMEKETVSIHNTLFTLLKLFDTRFTECKRRRSLIDFNDIEHLTLKLLYDENDNVSSIATEISDNLDEIYVDEYQDLNPLQNKIFKALSVNCPIFMVGDIKQSIYGFRGADPQAFSSYKTSLPEYNTDIPVVRDNRYNDHAIFLSNNYRSQFTVTEFSNAVSDAIFANPNNSDIYKFRIPYTKNDRLLCSAKNQECLPPTPVVILNCEQRKRGPDEDKPSSFALEADNVANEIASLIERGVEASNIAILLKSAKTPAPIFEKALKARNIPVNSEKGTKLLDMPEIQLALCLLNCCDNPYRDVFLAGALRSPIFGFTLDDMVKIRRSYPSAPSLYDALVTYTEENDFDKGRKFEAFIKKMRKFAMTEPVDRILWHIYNETSFFSVIYDGGTIDTSVARARRANLIRLHEIAKSYSSSHNGSLYGFIERLRLLIDDKTAPTAAITEGNAVKLMTVHASKGLEFEYCFFCGTSHSLDCKEAQSGLIFEPEIGIGAILKLYEKSNSLSTPYHASLKNWLKIKSLDEDMRLLYVALTRAQTRLYVSAQLPSLEVALNDSALNAIVPQYYSFVRKASYVYWILTALKTKSDLSPAYRFVNRTEEEVNAESLIYRNKKRVRKDNSTALIEKDANALCEEIKKKLSFNYPDKNSIIIPSKLAVSKLTPDTLDDEVYFGNEIKSDDKKEQKDENAPKLREPDFMLGIKEASGADRGTATHVFMQFCSFDNLVKNGVDAEIDRLTEKRFILEEHKKLIDRNAINEFLKSDIFKIISEAAEINREYRFNIKLPASEFTRIPELKNRLANNTVFVQGIIDCYLRDKNGDIILIDYKTDRIPKENMGSRALQDSYLIEHYAPQLQHYRTALKMLTGMDVKKTYIYSFTLARAIEIA